MRKEYELTDDQLDALKVPSATPYIVVGGFVPASPQELANLKWQALATILGFVWDSVKPSEKGERFFTAEACDD